MPEPLSVRRELLRTCILPRLGEPIRYCPELDASLAQVIESVRTAGLEGLVAKHRDSPYEPGSRSGAWRKMRLNRGQEFVIGGYTLGASTFDALVFGCYEGDRLVYVGRTRSGFTPAVRAQLWRRFRGLEVGECPFTNLPEERSGRWGQGLTADKMRDCRWLKPVLVGHFEYVERTPDNHLRHASFIALREDRDAREVRKEP
jgi:bifunctional non-homologous end joining protein LigD